MERRAFINKGLMGIATLGVCTFGDKASASATRQGHAKQIVCFHAGSAEIQAEDGNWHIVVMPDPRGTKSPARIKLAFEVASDIEFQNKVATEYYFAERKNSYIVRVIYHPHHDETLYYRFVAVEIKRDSARGVYAPHSPSSAPRQLIKQV